MGVAACKRGLSLSEVDTVFERRSSGQSFLADLPMKVIAKIVWEVFKFKTELVFEKRLQKEKAPTLEPLSAVLSGSAGGES